MRRVLILSEYFPDKFRPNRGIFILEQAQELAKFVNATVISSIAVSLSRKKFKPIREGISQVL